MTVAEFVTFVVGLLISALGLATYVFIVTGIWRNSKSEKRATELLSEILSDGEYQQLKAHGYLDVPSPSIPGRVYRVPAHRDQVEILDSGRLTARLCVQPVRWLPTADVVLMHKLMIEGNESEYLRLANSYSGSSHSPHPRT